MQLYLNSDYKQALQQWFEEILKERYGLPIKIEFSDTSASITLQDQEGSIEIPKNEIFYQFQSSNIPFMYLELPESCSSPLGKKIPAPGYSSLTVGLINSGFKKTVINYDILGLTFWMLSRIEEVNCTRLDNHERFPSVSSHASKHGYLDRPIVDEWLIILGKFIQMRWPEVQTQAPISDIVVSCDVDTPYLRHLSSLVSTTKIILGDLFKRKSFTGAMKNFKRYLAFKAGDLSEDPFYQSILWMMTENEKHNRKMIFYFIPESIDDRYDASYNAKDPIILDLINTISERGHEIGIHPSYTTLTNPDQLKREVTLLNEVFAILKKNKKAVESRQHYLRWKTPQSANDLDSNGIIVDSSLSYADRAGYRCGTCHSYKMFDPVAGRMLRMRQRPLILMEASVIDPIYMNLGYSKQSLEYMLELKRKCNLMGGTFTLLWHNSHLRSEKDKEFYLELIK